MGFQNVINLRITIVMTTSNHAAHHKKVKHWFLNPDQFCQEIESEQKKYLSKCIYHLSKSHVTVECLVKKECDKILVAKKDGHLPSSSKTSGHLRNIKEEEFEDAVSADTLLDSSSNVTKEDDLH
jgi:hypothetical protein